eukprot:3583176-Pyramimonas_sp.AAC.1
MTAPRRLRMPPESSENPPRGPRPSNTDGKTMCCLAFSLFRLRRALEASRWPQDGPESARKRSRSGESPQKAFLSLRRGV